MLKQRKDGSFYYYYYKKKKGRHKKPGKTPAGNIFYGRSYVFYKNYCRKYLNKYEFKAAEPKRYSYCEDSGYIDKIYPYVCKYTKQECKKKCFSYKNSDELKKDDIGLYECIEKHGWVSDMFPWCKERYTINNCRNEAMKYNTYKEFRSGSNSIYTYCLHNDLLKTYVWLKDDRVSMYKDKIHCVYCYMFEAQSAVYVGRTLVRRIDSRHWEHSYKKNDTVYKYIMENNIQIPEIHILEKDLTLNESLERENFYIEYYCNKGYNILNKARTGIGIGSIGSIASGKWNKNTCYREALKYTRRVDFERNSYTACRVARKNGWIDEYTWFKEKPKYNYYTFEMCRDIAKKYKKRNDFYKGDHGAYNASYRNNWLDIFFKHNSEKNGYTYMKVKKFYKIDINTMTIVGEYKKVKEFTNDVKHIYKVLNGELDVFDDGYLYRRECDIEINTATGQIIDKLSHKSVKAQKEKKYEYVINLLKNTDFKISEIYRMSNMKGYKISDPTCRKLAKIYRAS